MATITITLVATVDGKAQTLVKTATIPDAAMPAFFAYYQTQYGVGPQGNVTSAESVTPVTNSGTPNADAYAAFSDGLMTSVVADVNKYAQAQAAIAAAAAVPTITVTAS